jgi:hypothetical protein
MLLPLNNNKKYLLSLHLYSLPLFIITHVMSVDRKMDEYGTNLKAAIVLICGNIFLEGIGVALFLMRNNEMSLLKYIRRYWNITTQESSNNDNIFCHFLSALIIKQTRWTNFSNLFWNIILHISDRFSAHHQESSTVRTEIGVCHTVLDSWWWRENLSETCRVLFQK